MAFITRDDLVKILDTLTADRDVEFLETNSGLIDSIFDDYDSRYALLSQFGEFVDDESGISYQEISPKIEWGETDEYKTLNDELQSSISERDKWEREAKEWQGRYRQRFFGGAEPTGNTTVEGIEDTTLTDEPNGPDTDIMPDDLFK